MQQIPVIAFAVFLSGLLPSQLCAQTSPPVVDSRVTHEEGVRAALGKLQPGIEIRARSGAIITAGRFVRSTGDSLWISQSNASTTSFRYGAIDGLWSSTPAGGRGALIGAALGALAVGT
ncbi:MAG TPA: hypothetical protein VM939_05370, partial [Gemmatimonadaceae bacterium]|nr:hypothetical protein [Gemmatimonadaceae bacterium]